MTTATVRRATYESLTPEQRRVAIATDAKEQVLAKRMILRGQHGYVTPRSQDHLVGIGRQLLSRPIEPTIDDDDLVEHCHVCALGGMFLASVRLFDCLPVDIVIKEISAINEIEIKRTHYAGTESDYGQGSNLVGYDSLQNMLCSAFSFESQEMIENAFEGQMIGDYVAERFVLDTDARPPVAAGYECAAIDFYNQFDDDESCFIAICDNIIENGDFVIPFDPLVAAERAGQYPTHRKDRIKSN